MSSPENRGPTTRKGPLPGRPAANTSGTVAGGLRDYSSKVPPRNYRAQRICEEVVNQMNK
jgi:hypothetical protein